MTSKLAKPTHLPKPTGRTHAPHDDDPVTLAVRRLSEEVAKRRVSENDPLHTSALRRFSEDTRRDSIPEDNTVEWLLARRMSEAGISSRKGSDASVILTENTDSFIIGDRVYVNGMKPGYIQYIGETQFAPGEWAGIVLDKPLGKNDGSVSGVRYFMCEPKRGVFSRLTRLTRQPLVDGDLSEVDENINEYHSSPKTSVSERADMRKASISTLDIKVGDRVVVFSNTGTKTGYLRYIGTTNFAQGEWAGVELDEPLGKNDGSVAGKRYFECTNKFGLFAPVHKVSKVGSRASSTPKSSIGLHKTTSKESLDSLSGVRSPRKTTPGKANSTPTNATTNALQEALRQKEEHVDQLLKERDLERGEIARAASQIEAKEKEILHLKLQYEHVESKVVCLEDQMSLLKNENSILREALDDEKRKLEEIEFRLAEETINVGAIEDENQNLSKIRDLEKKLKIEQAKVENLEKESNKCFELTEQLTIQKEEIESLKTELSVLKDSSLHFKPSSDESGVEQVQLELSQMKELLKALEDQLNQSRADHEEKDKLIIDFQTQLGNSICEETQELRSNLSTVEVEKEKLVGLLDQKERTILSMESEKQLLENNLSKSKADWESEKDEISRKKDLEIYELQEQNMTLESKLSDFQEKISDLELQCKQAENKNNCMPELENRFEILRAEKQKAVDDKEEVLKQKAELQLEKARLEAENSNWKKCHEENSLKVTERDQKLTLLTQEVNRLRDTFSSHKKELESELEQSQQEAGAMEDLRHRLEAQQGELDRLQEALQESENLREQAESEKTDLAHKLENAQEDGSRTKQDSERYLELQGQLENELRNLKTQLEERTGQLTQQHALTAQLTKRISDFEAKSTTASESVNGNEETQNSTAPSQDKEAMNSQINFLNSVIVDMHKKNDELKTRLEILQADPSTLNNNIDTKKKPMHVAPRLFCDICEMFDIHDTEDCPKQVLSENGPQLHQGDRNIERPYCDACEVFGHSTSNCDDNETF